MKLVKVTFSLFFSAILLFSGNTLAKSHHNPHQFGASHRPSSVRLNKPGLFDYYLLALSWSPEFCTTDAGHKPEKKEQCDGHFGFVVHGLWPQNKKGFPQNCGKPTDVPPEIAAIVLSGELQMPPGDSQFINHEWSKHGTCSGLGMTDYFQAIKSTAAKVKIPDELSSPTQPVMEDFNTLAKQFSDKNPGLTANMIQVITDQDRKISEIHICLNKELSNFQPCTGNSSNNGGTFLPVH